MGKDPAVLFYTSDFLSGVQFFTDEQIGQYIKLLCQQHQLGNIPEFQMLKICGSIESPVIKKFKKDEDGTWYNERMKFESEKRSNYSKSRAENIGKRWCKNDKPLSNKKIDSIHMNKHMNIHMENENENRNDNINEIKKAFKIPVFEEVKKYCDERKNNIDPQQFIDHYEARGWMLGKVKMKSWQAAIRTWEKNNFNRNSKTPEQQRSSLLCGRRD